VFLIVLLPIAVESHRGACSLRRIKNARRRWISVVAPVLHTGHARRYCRVFPITTPGVQQV